MPRDIQGRRVCVVGGAGFLGSHLVNYLVGDKKCDVLVVDNLIAGRREFIHEEARFEHHDITGSEDHLLSLLLDHGTEFVFNYAAEPYIPVSFERPLHVFNVNAFGALKVINAAQEAGCEAILQVSSAEIYGGEDRSERFDHRTKEESHRKISEDDPITPHSTYGAAKAAIDALVQVRVREAKTPVIALRQFNCVGERETHPYVIPEIINQIVKSPLSRSTYGGYREILLGNNSSRDFLYAGDAARMAVELLESGEFGQVYNLGSEQSIKMYDLAKLIGEISGVSVRVQPDPRRVRPWEIWHLQSDNTKIYSIISLRPKISLKEAIERTIGWYKENKCLWPWER